MDQYLGVFAIVVVCGSVFFLVALLLHLGKPKPVEDEAPAEP